jgi:redox-sensitive bicupin YhaK (pirin superfamily)
MEIITIVLEGVLAHKDNMGHEETIQPGEVQVMSAGTGVYHSEYNHSPDKKVKLFQTWLFPNKRDVQPRYDQRSFAEADRINNLQTLVSPIENDDPGLKIHQDAWIYRTTLQAGNTLSHALHSSMHGAYIFVIDGKLDAHGKTLNKRDALGVSETDSISIMAVETSDVLIFEVPMLQ